MLGRTSQSVLEMIAPEEDTEPDLGPDLGGATTPLHSSAPGPAGDSAAR